MNTNELLTKLKEKIDTQLEGSLPSQIWLNGNYGRVYIKGGRPTGKYSAWVDVDGECNCFDAYFGTYGITKRILLEIYKEVTT